MNVFNKSLSQENEVPKVSEEALDAMGFVAQRFKR